MVVISIGLRSLARPDAADMLTLPQAIDILQSLTRGLLKVGALHELDLCDLLNSM
jgi:hypothetical protein